MTDDLSVELPFVESPSGLRMYVDLEDTRAQELVRSDGALSGGSSRLWEATLAMQDWDVVVDVGANYGEMLLSPAVPDAVRRVCFEPNPRVLPYLRRTIAESGLDIDLRETAVGADNAEATFVVDTVWSGRSGLAGTHRTDEQHPLDEVVVPVRRLDAELDLDEDASVCIKVDVEGAEFDVLEGASDILEGSHSWAVMLEILHMDPFEKARLATEYTMQVMDRRTGELLVVPPSAPMRVSELLDAGWVHAQDAVLTTKAAS